MTYAEQVWVWLWPELYDSMFVCRLRCPRGKDRETSAPEWVRMNRSGLRREEEIKYGAGKGTERLVYSWISWGVQKSKKVLLRGSA